MLGVGGERRGGASKAAGVRRCERSERRNERRSERIGKRRRRRSKSRRLRGKSDIKN